jgi:hypothetical protein
MMVHERSTHSAGEEAQNYDDTAQDIRPMHPFYKGNSSFFIYTYVVMFFDNTTFNVATL